jgi:thiamine biosynthesis protein ThiS
MKLQVNGEVREFEPLADIAALVRALELDVRKVAVERNLEIVPRSLHASTPLEDGDRIEIVQFVGGG